MKPLKSELKSLLTLKCHNSLTFGALLEGNKELNLDLFKEANSKYQAAVEM